MNAKKSVSSRRQFLRQSGVAFAAVALPGILPSHLQAGVKPGDSISIACIGVGGHGTNRNLRMLLQQKDARIDAVCDVFDDRRDRALAMVTKHYGTKGCTACTDFRRIIDRKDIDAVMISTPDHWHVPMSLMAMRSGKDVICEKPTLTIEEGRILSDAVKEHRAVFQTSTEDRSLPPYHQMAQVVRNGLIGKVKRVEVQLPAGENFPDEKPAPVPRGLDYNLWIGPAPFAPFTPQRTERQHWRHIWDYSGGKFSDWGMHQLDTVQWALDKESTGPVMVEGKGAINEGSMYNTFVTYDLEYRYEDGIEIHIRSGNTSLKFTGSEGWVGNDRFAAPVKGSDAEFARWKPAKGDVKLYTQPAGEHRDFLDCVKSRRDPYFPAETGHRCATLLHMGNIAMRLGRKLKWDPVKEEFPGDAEANAMRSRKPRAPWRLEA